MQFTINTTKFQELVAKAVKGSSNNKLLPITSLMAIDLAGKRLVLTTTDTTNYFQVSTAVDTADTFSIVVLADSFAKLISKMTCENITLDIEADSLTVLGGKSKYKIELPLDVDGTFVKLTAPPVLVSKSRHAWLHSVMSWDIQHCTKQEYEAMIFTAT